MTDFRSYFKGKKVTVMGLGLLGRGVRDAAFLAECGARVLVTDLKSATALESSLQKLRKYKNIQYILGEHRFEDFQNCDMVLKAAGVPLDSPYIEYARGKGIPIEMDESLFAKLAPKVKIIGVTGTRGKSTTTMLIYEILKATGVQVYLGGNIIGTAALPLLHEVKDWDVVVFELSSWQLQGFGEAKISPSISVFTNFMHDHMNYYGNNFKKYFKDKSFIYEFQKQGDILVLGPSMKGLSAQTGKIKNIKSKIIHASVKNIPKSNLPGKHNLENIACALEVVRFLKVPEKVIEKTLENFKPVPGRLELVDTVKGVKIYNDNSSTTPDATIAALQAVGDSKKRNVVLIIGGDNKFLDMSKLLKEIPKFCSKVVLFKERGTDLIRDKVFEFRKKGIDVYEEEGLENTVRRAFAVAQPGDTLLYSPAFSSFGKYFKNEYDRGDQFLNIIGSLNEVKGLDFSKIKKVFFIGIGGIGISALAKMFISRGVEVLGINDEESPKTLDSLRDAGAMIYYQNEMKELPDADLYVFSDAWIYRGPELILEARKRGVPVMSYFEALGEVAKAYKVIAISGTHGKTTTTAMVGEMMIDAGLDPTIIVGSFITSLGSNFRKGDSEYLVVEADEYNRHFLNFKPFIAVVINIEADHLDFYKDLADIKDSFDKFVAGSEHAVLDYSKYIKKVPKLALPGEHNRSNAAAALAVADILKIPLVKAKKSLTSFSGTWRRLEKRGETKEGTIIYDDYAHHPTEIKASLQALRELYPKEGKNSKKITVLFQPHLYSRTKALFDDFAKSFGDADTVLLLPIYFAREDKDESVSSDRLAMAMCMTGAEVKAFASFELAEEYVKALNLGKNDVFVTMGAGEAYKVADKVFKI